MTLEVLRTSPIHDRHVALGAKLADFGGWEMPIEYPGRRRDRCRPRARRGSCQPVGQIAAILGGALLWFGWFGCWVGF